MRNTLMALILVLAFAGQSFAAEKYILFINRAEQDIRSIFLAPAGTGDYGDDLLLKRKLKMGRNTKLSVPHDRGDCRWDIKYVVRSKLAYTIKNVDICKAVEIELFLKGEQAWANIK